MLHLKFNKRILLIVIPGMLLWWAACDLYLPRSTDLRQFDPSEVAHLDTVMWRSYYEREPVKLFFQLAELLRRQFGLPYLRSHLLAYDAAKAAFVFKRGHDRADYEKALPNLASYYLNSAHKNNKFLIYRDTIDRNLRAKNFLHHPMGGSEYHSEPRQSRVRP